VIDVNDILKFVKWHKLQGHSTTLSTDESYLIINEIERIRGELKAINENGKHEPTSWIPSPETPKQLNTPVKMIKYKIEHYLRAEITAVDIDRETDDSVWIKGERMKKLEHFFDTWGCAKNHLVVMADAKLLSARLSLDNAQQLHGQITGMKQ